jgi:hypothetical protein
MPHLTILENLYYGRRDLFTNSFCHGFERADRVVDVNQVLAREGISGQVELRTGFLTTRDPAVSQWLRAMAAAGKYRIGHVIPTAELQRFAPHLAPVSGSGRCRVRVRTALSVWPCRARRALRQPAEVGVHTAYGRVARNLVPTLFFGVAGSSPPGGAIDA